MIDGLVYRKMPERAHFAVPDSMITSLIKLYHDEMAHCGLETTVQGMCPKYWFPAMRKRVRDYIDNCITCLLSDSSVNRFEGESHIDLRPEKPFEIIHIDYYGLLQKMNDGYKYVFAVIDAIFFAIYVSFRDKRNKRERSLRKTKIPVQYF